MSTPRIEQLLYLANRAPIARTFGMILSFNADQSAVVDLPYNPGLNHVMAGIHGGVHMTLLDSAAWFTSAAAHENVWVATSEMAVHFLRPTAKTALRCVGRMLKPGKRQDIVEAHLYDSDGQLVGHGVGTFTVLPDISMPEISEGQ